MPHKRKAPTAERKKPMYQDDISDPEIPEPSTVPTKRPKTRTTAKQQKITECLAEEGDEAEGEKALEPPSSAGQESQQVFEQAFHDYAKKKSAPKDSFVHKFVAEVEKEEKAVVTAPEKWEKKCKANSNKYRKFINAEILSALSVPTHGESKAEKNTANADYSSHPLYNCSNTWLNLAEKTLKTYKSACLLFTDSKAELQPLGQNWQDELDALVSILEMGQRAAKRQVEKIAGEGEKKKGTFGAAADESEDFDQAMKLLGMVIEDASVDGAEGGVSWVESVRAVEKGTKRLVMGLPGMTL